MPAPTASVSRTSTREWRPSTGARHPSQRVAADGENCASFCAPENLDAAEADAANILAGLVSVNDHLDSVCNSSVVSVRAAGVG